MTYRHTSHLLGDYLDGELTSNEKSLVEAHVAVCARCREELEHLRKLITTLGQIESPDPGDEYFHNLLAIVTARTSGMARGLPSSPPVGTQIGPGRNILKILIRLAATITLLFAAFYISDFNQERRAARWPGKYTEGKYVLLEDSETIDYPGHPLAGFNMVGIPAPDTQDENGRIEPADPDE